MPKACPAFSKTLGAQKGALSDCVLTEGYFCVFDSQGVCTPTLCPSGSYCPGKISVSSSSDNGLRPCDPTKCASTCSVTSPVGSTDESQCGCECIPVDCVMSDWVDDGACQPNNVLMQKRTVLTPAVNGGAACPTDLTREQPCVYCSPADIDNFDAGNLNKWDKTTTMATELCANTITPGTCTGAYFPLTPYAGPFSAYNPLDGDPGVTKYCTKATYNLSAGNLLNFAWTARWDIFAGTLPRTFAVEVKDANGVVVQSTTILTAQPRTSNTSAPWALASVPMPAVPNAKLCFVWTVPESYTGPASSAVDNVALSCAVP